MLCKNHRNPKSADVSATKVKTLDHRLTSKAPVFTFQYGFHVAETKIHTEATVMSAVWLHLNNIPGIKAFHCSLTMLMSSHDFPFNLTDEKGR